MSKMQITHDTQEYSVDVNLVSLDKVPFCILKLQSNFRYFPLISVGANFFAKISLIY
jgi:hypothetical protein